ncbi:peroxiredoxin [Pseudomonas migulae]|uniref:peroxiredoxin-like family protein n=1 Tax=Pseudomonas migulae TaxID=78543 RepID=UPI00209D2295|nr:peroxiredoxin [Pseudomonas migulae]
MHPANFFAGDEKNPLAGEDQEILRNSILELCESRISTLAIKAGDRAPDFALADANGDDVNSIDLVRKGPMIVVFLRGLWCWYSHATLIALETISETLNNIGVSIVAISPQLHFSDADMDRKQQVSFPILCDAHSRVALEFQVAWRLSAHLKNTYRALGADLDKMNGADCDLLPMASLFVIDRQGTIVYSEVNADHIQSMNTEELLIVLNNMPSPRKIRALE